MPQSDKDDLADALARLADGEVAPSEHELVDETAAPSAVRPERTAAPADRIVTPPPMPAPLQIATPADAVEQIILDDDDAMAMPAPDVDSFVPRHPAAHRKAVYQTLEFRRTLIPVLLTCGVLMIGFASARHLVGSDSPLADLPPLLPTVLLLSGTVLLVLALLNMLSVKRKMAEHDLRVDKLRQRLL